MPDVTSRFVLNFDIKDIESMLTVSKPSLTINGYAEINEQGRTGGVATGDAVFQNPTLPEMVFTIGNPYVSNLADTSFTTQQQWRSVAFTSVGGAVQATLPYTGSYGGVIRHFGSPNSTLSSDLVKENYQIVVTAKGVGCTLNVGDNVPFTTAGRTITLNSDSSTATLSASAASVGGTFTATILAKVFVVNAEDTSHILRSKRLITANTTAINSSNTQVATYTFVDDTAITSSGQVYIQNTGLVTPGNKQFLYLSDVKRVVKIIDTGAPGVSPTVGMLSNSLYDVTNNYIFDNGQRDSFYDHASISLKPGATRAKGNILVLVDYYQHSGGDGYFSVESYTNELYQQIPEFTSSSGVVYSLRDCLDFRPSKLNAQTAFAFRYSNGASNRGIFLPVDLTQFLTDYTYYLGRKDKFVLTKDKNFEIIEGTASVNPIFPSEPDGSLVVAQLTHTPYTGYIPTETPPGYESDLSIDKVSHKRYTMRDIAGLEKRINQVEYYTSLSMLEQKASSLQISDAFGLNRFKNGIMVDDFSSFAVADTLSSDFFSTINRRERVLTAAQNVKNFPLKAQALVYNMGKPSQSISNSLGYSIKSDGYVNFFTLPYTTSNVVVQKFASRTVNVNPFSFSTKEGVISLSPNVDNWVDTNYSPALLVTGANLNVFQSNPEINTLVTGDWQAVSGTSITTEVATLGGITTTTTTTTNLAQSNILGPYQAINNTYALNNGFITDISILPYIRPQQIVVRAEGLLINTQVYAQFDGTDVSNYMRKTNIIELNNVTGTFNKDDVIGYITSGAFTPTARIVGVYKYPETTRTRLYVAGDGNSNTYTTSSLIQNGFYNTSGVYQSTTASGTVSSSSHFGGVIKNVDSSTKLRLSSVASTVNNHFTGNTIYIVSGSGRGQSATITSYFGANQTAILASSITPEVGDIYSIGTFKTDESGSFYGIFNLPPNTFYTGERVLTINNNINGNLDSSTTFAKGTYYAQGLQVNSQQLDFGASPSGAKGTFSSTQYSSTTNITTSFTPNFVPPPQNNWDPVAQTFIVSKDSYPNGLFIDSIKIFFKTKPVSDSSSITLSIVGTLNGYPNGETLDHSIVTLTPEQVKISENPQFLDAATFTTFNFTAPIYIQSGVLYAFILKSNSNEYIMWTAASQDDALLSSVKNLPSDPNPSTRSKIGAAPSVGALFLSQNSQTWTADQNQSLMFVIDRCVFDTSASPVIQYLVPQKLPQRTLIDQSLDYFLNANSVLSSTNSVTDVDVRVGAFNITTTDFTPSTTKISYSYNATLQSGLASGIQFITPGKFGTSSSENIYLNDGKGERILSANSVVPMSVFAQLSSIDSAVSPVISDAGLSAYTVTWNVNNCELSNSLITITNAGSGYSNNISGNTTVTISPPTGEGGIQATAAANVVGGIIDSIYFTNLGSGYITTPTISIVDANTSPGTGATATIRGETSEFGGPGIAKYVTKKVVLDAGFDSGDLNVYITAYRPVNTNILVYYKLLNRYDTQAFNDGTWQLMTPINDSGSTYSQSRDNMYEYTFAPGVGNVSQGYVSYTSTTGETYITFSQFAIKVVLTTTDKTAVPVIEDIRTIALPPNVNTVFQL